MTEPTNTVRWLYGLIGIAVVAGVAAAVWLNLPGDDAPPPETSRTAAPPPTKPALPISQPRDYPLPKLSETPFLNTGADAKYLGSNSCVECHSGHYDSYLLTHHSRALADIDPRIEPPDGSFFHQPSGRSYRVYRKDGQFRHEEVLRTPEGKEISRTDLPIRYVIGSGNFCRSYLVEVDGFLHESPITWYAARKKWDMSPGYDAPRTMGFQRPVNQGCVSCHSGRVELQEAAVHKLAIREEPIGCESCHGPGSKHVELRRGRKLASAEKDLTIVNPGKLSRAMLESVCAVCHETGQASILLRGRKLGDYRPGRALSDYRVDYTFDVGNEKMTVVGHLEQLRRSKCYQKSELTCVTCHDPHARARPANPVAFYRQKCLDCHASKGCSLPQSERLKKDSTDNCITCHMPRTDTEIPHLAFVHHRIGKHGAEPPAPERTPRLVPIGDDSHLAAVDRKRNLGLAYLEVAEKPEHRRWAPIFREQARTLLEDLYAAGLRDGAACEALAEVYRPQQDLRAGFYAGQALMAKDLTTVQQAQAMAVLADDAIRAGDVPSAAKLLEGVTKLRRGAQDWVMLARCRLTLEQPQSALDALKQAEVIRPDRPDTHQLLAEAYRQLGDAANSRENADKAKWLLEHLRE
jgi:hypothetical protein